MHSVRNAVDIRQRLTQAVRPLEERFPSVADHPLDDAIDQMPTSRGFISMLEAYRATGGLAPGNFLCQALQEHQRGDFNHLASLIVDRRIFALDWRGDSWIPMFQFNVEDLSCKPAPAQVRAELEGLASGWTIAAWFAQPNPLLEGRRPVNLIEADLPHVLHAARCRSMSPGHGIARA